VYVRAVIMAGGEGVRLRPLTCTLPKPMVPILNRPMMEHIINLLKKHGLTELASTLWYLPDDVTNYFQDGSAFGVSMDYFIETKPLGTAGSVKNAGQFLTDTFLVVSGDALTDINLSAAIDFHRRKGSLATLVLTRVPNPLSYGVVLTADDGRITQFLEKPTWSQVFSDTVNTGIYILELEVLDLVPPGQKVDFSQDVFPELLRRKAPMYGYVASGYWSDVGNLEVYRQAQKDCLDGKVQIDLPPPLSDHLYLEEGVHIHDSAHVEGPVYIGKDVRIGAGVYVGPYSVIGPYSQIDSHASLKQSLLWSGVRVGGRTQLRGCVLAKDVWVEKAVEIYEGAVLGPKVRVGAQSTIAPNTKVWPEKVILSGTKLRSSLVWGSQEQRPIFTKHGIAGDIRGNLTPEILTQLGFSYAAFLGGKSRVLVTSDVSKVADLAKRALVVGLRGGGLDIHDGGDVVGRMTRSAVQEMALDGALHVGVEVRDPNLVYIECWDGRGRFLSKGDQRKIEGIFVREDYPRFGADDLGDFIQVAGLRKRYLQRLAKHYPSGSPHFQVGLLVDPAGDPFGELVRDFLKKSGYEVVTDAVAGIPTIVVQDREWCFQDEKGRRLTNQDWWLGFVQALKGRSRKAVAMPVHISEKAAKTATEQGLDVCWTKMEASFWMEVATELGNTLLDENLEVFPHIEPLASIGELLFLISSSKIPLSSWHGTTHMKEAEVECPWDEKGRVMRKLIESSDPENTLYLDGIKERRGAGWALVVPDGDEPVFRLYSEAETEWEANSLIQHYVNLIQRHQSEER
jgi:mannose-1-phosphate guanylyltransferase/phosphomannomutase